jgi:hypothetical protein
MCANEFLRALRGDEVRFAYRLARPRGSFQPEEILLALSRHEVPFVVIGDWAAAAQAVMLIEVAPRQSAAGLAASRGENSFSSDPFR